MSTTTDEEPLPPITGPLGAWSERDARELARLERLQASLGGGALPPKAFEDPDRLAELRRKFGVSDAEIAERERTASEGELLARSVENRTHRMRIANVPADPRVLLTATMPGGDELLDEGERALWKREFAGRTALASTTALELARTWLGGGRVVGGDMDGETFTGCEWLLVLGGAIGCGKSTAAGLTVREFRGRSALWVQAEDVVEVKSDDLFKQAVAAELVVLDDVGFEYVGNSDWAFARLARLLVARQREWRRTLVTANMTKAVFLDLYNRASGGRLKSRMLNGAAFFEIAGKDLRATPL